MNQSFPGTSFVALLLVTLCAPALRAAPSLQLVTATYLGTAEDDDLQGAAAAPDGTIYVVGNTGAPARDLPGSIRVQSFGSDVQNPRCGHGFVAHLAGDGKRILQYAEFARGIALLTSVQCSEQGIYVGGYASDGLEPVLNDRPGLIRQYPLTAELKQYEADVAGGREDKIAGRPGLGRYGAPCVLRFSSDLQQLDAGTYLEGWQQVWDKKRVAKPGKEMLGGYQEYYWQPTDIGVLKGGDVVISHDGGYFRPWTDKDKQIANGDAKLFDRLTFYDTCDHVSRLSPDLTRRAWHKSVYTPPVKPDVAKEVKNGWPLDHYSSPRTQRMRLDKEDHIYFCGWSASATSHEPWWAPYLYKLDPANGDVLWHAYEYDPMSGGGNRMGGQVADTACVSLAIDNNGNILTSLLADGGNSVMEWSPTAEKLNTPSEVKARGGGFGVKLVHWWGQIQRVDANTRQALGRAKIGPWGWAHDLAALPDNGVLAFGRYNWKFDFTPDAWWTQSSVENPIAFIRAYSPDMDMTFSTAVPGVVPFEIARAGANRYILVGRAEAGAAPAKDAMLSKSPGKTDGYLMIIDVK